MARLRHSHLRAAVGGQRTQRGLATLTIVMLLFFAVAMVAAYTSRNLIFEQRTGANQFRSAIAFQAAEAGVDWTLAMLNGGAIGDDCTPSVATPGPSFQQRYLRIASVPPDPSTSANAVITQNDRLPPFTPPPFAGPDPLDPPAYWPACSLEPGTWGHPNGCACPNTTAIPLRAAPAPAFRVWLARPPSAAIPLPDAPPPGVFHLQVNGCTRSPAITAGRRDCLDQSLDIPTGSSDTVADLAGDALATVRTMVALRSAILAMPSAAITAQGQLRVLVGGVPGGVVQAENTDRSVGNLTVLAGGAIPGGNLFAIGAPGTPGNATWVAADQRLASFNTVGAGGNRADDSRMFISQFGMKPAAYRDQPGARRCPEVPGGSCDADALRQLVAFNPQRVMWVRGDITLSGTLGAPDAPVMLVIDRGSLTLAPGAIVHGMVYLTGVLPVGGGALQSTVLAPRTGQALISGSLVADGDLVVEHPDGAALPPNGLRVVYDRGQLNRIRTAHGSWVRLPGGWRDFKD